MSLLNNKSRKIKKIIVVVLCIFFGIIIGFISDKLSNGKIVDFITLSVMYFQNSEEIKFNGILLKAPFRYIRAQTKDNLTLLSFPKGGGVIFFDKKHLSKETFNNEFKEAQYKMHFELINEGEITIDNEKGYFFAAAKKTNPTEYEEYLTIPTKRIVVSFVGDRKNSQDFWKIVRQIHFIAVERN